MEKKFKNLKEYCIVKDKGHLLDEWDYESNGEITPNTITYGSNKVVSWKCRNGHSWLASIKARTSRNGQCPICSNNKNKLIVGVNDLQTLRPDIAKEFNSVKNGFEAKEIASGSHTKVWWICEKGHEWEASPNHRTSKTRNCPYCCLNPRVLKGYNDLLTLYPHLAEEWDFEKNEGLQPDMVTSKSSKYVWWKCKKGHEWKTSIEHRTNGSGCPGCSSGMQTSFPEQAIFYYVKKYYCDAINGYTDIFNNHGMEIDIYVPSLKIGIEYDGVAFHRTIKQKEREIKKYNKCKANNIKLVRIREDFTNLDENTCDVLILLKDDLNSAILQLNMYLKEIKDVNIDRDRTNILESYYDELKNNSLRSLYPTISIEWNYEKNGILTPDMFFPGSGEKVYWKCSLGHEWKAQIGARVRGDGCPYCSNNKILPGFNDLATRRKDLIMEWDFKKNKDIDPTSVSCGSGKKAWWMCLDGHSWKAEISSRNKGAGCPYCAGNKK